MYLSIAAEHAHMPAQLIHEIYRSVLTFDADSKEFSDFYSERKKLLSELKNTDDEAIDFWKKALKLDPENELLQKKVKHKTFFYK